MTEKLIPLLRNIKTKEPSVALAAVGVYEAMGKKLGHDVVASDILPALWPMSVGVLLTMEQVIDFHESIWANIQFNRLMAVIKDLENKVVHQQTQKLQELGPSSNTPKTTSSPMQDSSTLGPMEEMTLDFENLVLGNKNAPPAVSNIASKPPSSQPLSTFQTQAVHQHNPSPRPTTPMSLMQPIQPTTPTPAPPQSITSSTAFYPPLQPSSTTGFTAPAVRNNGVFPSSSSVFPTSPSAFTVNPWTTGGNSSFSAGNSGSGIVPTIAPPPPQPAIPSFAATQQQAKPAQGDGLDKYQSLL